jgi:hypothetical protein
MSGKNKKVVLLAMLLVGLFAWFSWSTAQVQDPQESVRRFVQQFYDWYGTISHKNSKLTPDQRAIKEKAQIFSAQLISALKEDYEASSKSPEEIVGLDWDPFLCSQELDDRYEVGGIKKQGQNYLIEVYGVSEGKKNSKPNVIAEVEQKDGHWVFINFHSPHGGDLLSDLKELKQSRDKTRK